MKKMNGSKYTPAAHSKAAQESQPANPLDEAAENPDTRTIPQPGSIEDLDTDYFHGLAKDDAKRYEAITTGSIPCNDVTSGFDYLGCKLEILAHMTEAIICASDSYVGPPEEKLAKTRACLEGLKWAQQHLAQEAMKPERWVNGMQERIDRFCGKGAAQA